MNSLLLECCRPHPDDSEIRRLAAASPDWTALTAVSVRSKLAPLFFWGLEHACADLVPPEVLAKLRGHFDFHTRRNLLFSSDLHRILDLLLAGGVRVLPFKGPTLAWSIYPVPGLRPMSDLDLFIAKSDLRIALRLFETNGYRRQASGVDIRFFMKGGEAALTASRGAKVDLHWRLAPAYFGCLDSADFWGRAVQIEIAGRQTSVFCPEDSLLFLCVHGGKHSWRSLIWIADLARLISAVPLDWDRVLAQAAETRLARTILLGTYLAQSLFGSELPPEVQERAKRDPAIAGLATRVRSNLERGGEVRISDSLSFQCQLLESTADRMRFLALYLQPTEADWDSLHIPASLMPLYYVARPFRLVWQYALRQNHDERRRRF